MLLLSIHCRPTPSKPCGRVWILSCQEWLSASVWVCVRERVYCKTNTFDRFFCSLWLHTTFSVPITTSSIKPTKQKVWNAFWGKNIGTNHTHWVPVLLLCSFASLQPSFWFTNAARNWAQHPGIDHRSTLTNTHRHYHYAHIDSYIRLASMQIHTFMYTILPWICSLLVSRNANEPSSLFLFRCYFDTPSF